MKRDYIPHSLKHAIRDRDHSTCCYCNKYVPKKHRSYDHVIPHSHGGTDTPDNLVLTCISCNSQKRDKTLPEYCEYLVLAGKLSYASSVNVLKRVERRLTTQI